MRRRWFACSVAAAAVGLGSLVFGCIVFTGGTGGYSAADSGQQATVSACAAAKDGGVCVVLQCSAAIDCAGAADAGDAAPEVCCVGLSDPTTFGFTCQSSCVFGSVQACAGNAECGDASCIRQACVANGTEYDIKVCGLVPACTPIAASSADGGGTDASAPLEAGALDGGALDTGSPDVGSADAGPLDASGLDGAG